jgi:deoxyribodipyrimidine photo-lyase
MSASITLSAGSAYDAATHARMRGKNGCTITHHAVARGTAAVHAQPESVTWLDRPASDPDVRDAGWVERLLDLLAARVPPPIGGACTAAHPVRHGGRDAALAALAMIDPAAYARTRNHLDGGITRLSPWLRHGVLSLAEVRDAAIGCVASAHEAEKLVSELAWRDYWQRVYASRGVSIDSDLEPPAAAATRGHMLAVPADVLAGSTGMACVDAFVRELYSTGFLHNHARMWLASWLIHARGVRWQAGAAWFLSHLLDADPASNTLSWQWVAGTFASKPYIFNRENLERFTNGRFCGGCAVAGHCDLEGSYEELAASWFSGAPLERPRLKIPPSLPWQPAIPSLGDAAGGRIVWLTLNSLAETSPAAAAHPLAPRIFLFDPAWFARERPSRLRLRFMLECLADIPRLDIGVGPSEVGLHEALQHHRATHVAVADTPCPFTRQAAAQLALQHAVEVVSGPAFVNASRVTDLGRFSRYWSLVRTSAMVPTQPSR